MGSEAADPHSVEWYRATLEFCGGAVRVGQSLAAQHVSKSMGTHAIGEQGPIGAVGRMPTFLPAFRGWAERKKLIMVACAKFIFSW